MTDTFEAMFCYLFVTNGGLRNKHLSGIRNISLTQNFGFQFPSQTYLSNFNPISNQLILDYGLLFSSFPNAHG